MAPKRTPKKQYAAPPARRKAGPQTGIQGTPGGSSSKTSAPETMGRAIKQPPMVSTKLNILKRGDKLSSSGTQTSSTSCASILGVVLQSGSQSTADTDSAYNKQSLDHWSEIAEDPYSMPPSKSTGMPDGFDSDSDTLVYNFGSRLNIFVAVGNKEPDGPSGLLEHLAEEDVVGRKPRIYFGSRLEDVAGFSSDGQPPKDKGKGKLSKMNQPLVLRQRPTSSRYQLVGVAYIHGIMKGEFIEQVLQTSERFLETYIIE